jgi:hypothetical protein
MEKFNSAKHFGIWREAALPFSYFSLPLYLDFSAYLLSHNGKDVIVAQDIYYPHEFPALFLHPNSKNWENFSVTFATDQDIKKVRNKKIEIILRKETGTEYFYNTVSLVNPTGKINQRIKQFKKLYGSSYKLRRTYNRKKIEKFYYFWKKQKGRNGDTFKESEKLFFFCLDNLRKYKIKQIYIEIGGKLAGLAFGVSHSSGGWVGLQLKVNYKYKGLSRFLHHERARLFSREKLFTLGTGSHDAGISQFKEELGPAFSKEYFYILTGKRKF